MSASSIKVWGLITDYGLGETWLQLILGLKVMALLRFFFCRVEEWRPPEECLSHAQMKTLSFKL